MAATFDPTDDCKRERLDRFDLAAGAPEPR
jgi:hypothetical protein